MCFVRTGLSAWMLAVCAWAQTSSPDNTMSEIASVRRFPEIAISPDGGRAAWVEAGFHGFVSRSVSAFTTPARGYYSRSSDF
jgi:hypothetical protein